VSSISVGPRLQNEGVGGQRREMVGGLWQQCPMLAGALS